MRASNDNRSRFSEPSPMVADLIVVALGLFLAAVWFGMGGPF
jgi:hypothetical protein